MSRWFEENEDPFYKVGYVRLIVVRHNPGYNFYGKLENCTQIANVETFAIGFACPEKSKSGYHSPSIGWLADEVHDSCDHKINHLFKNLPNGVYELTAEMWHWSSRSYEGEWDGDSELRASAIREISFDHAMYFECESLQDEMVQLLPNKESKQQYHSETDVHHYMPKKQILRNQANALTTLIQSVYSQRTNYNDVKEEDFEDLIFALMLQLDSGNNEELRTLAHDINDKVKNCIKSHHSLMDPDYA